MAVIYAKPQKKIKVIRILNIFQIKTVRSAWIFLASSGVMLVFGIYQILIAWSSYPINNSIASIRIISFLFWFLVPSAYIAISSWALFSNEGYAHLTIQEKIPIRGNRTILWYIKFLFACYAAALATMMLLGIILLPFISYAGLDIMFDHNNLYQFIIGLAWSPLIYRYLR